MYTACQTLGFVLFVTAAALSRPMLGPVWGWLAFLCGALVWLGCRTLFPVMAYFVPIRVAFWAAIATLAFIASAVVLAVSSAYLAAAVPAVPCP
jgi:hypothetical protein